MADSSALRVAYEPARPSGVPRPGAVRPGSAASYRPDSTATGTDLKPSSALTRPMSAPPVREDVRPGWRSGKSHTPSPAQNDATRKRNLRQDFYVQEDDAAYLRDMWRPKNSYNLVRMDIATDQITCTQVGFFDTEFISCSISLATSTVAWRSSCNRNISR